MLGNEGYCEELYVADLHNGAVVRLPRQGENHHPLVPSWSPNGQWIAYHDSGALSVVRPDGTGHREIVPHPYCPTAIAWSPDSERLAWFAHWCDEDETSPALLLVVNFDGSDMRLLWTRDDTNPHGSDVAFSPDGTYLAVRLDDGSVYRVDPECDSGPDGCDESSRTEMDRFPEHWLHTYWLQWDGEAAAGPTPTPGSPAEQARAFAGPILAAIANRPLDYEDDFDHPSNDWPAGPGVSGHQSHVEGEMGYDAGEYFAAAGARGHDEWACYGGDSLISFPADFVLDITGRLAPSADPNGDGDWQIQFRKWEFGGFYVLIVSQDRGVGLVRHGPGDGEEVGLVDYPAPFEDVSEANRFQIIARGPETAVYANREPLFYVYDSGYSERYGAGTINLGVCNLSDAPLTARWDNLRIWDISELELP